jgi:hypothetical protein
LSKLIITNGQYRINLPKDVAELTGWDATTELAIFPYVKELDSPITPDTPIVIKKIKKG